MAPDLSRELAVRWQDAAEPVQIAALFRQAGVTAVLPEGAGEAVAAPCRQAGIRVLRKEEIQFASLAELAKVPRDKTAVLTEGRWPGVVSPPNVQGRGDETATASADPWIDADGYWAAVFRALHPDRPAVLGYATPGADKYVPFESYELAFIDAYGSGGNYLLDFDERFRKACAAGDEKARAAWAQLGKTARWMRERTAWFRQATLPRVTVVVDHSELPAELVNLMYRRNVSPALVSPAGVPAPHPECKVLVAADLETMAAATRAQVLAHAQAGATVVFTAQEPDPAWKLVKTEEDRRFFQVGRGQVVIYTDAIADPSEFAMDVIDLVTHRSRAVRLWSAPSAIAVATGAPPDSGAKAAVVVINYATAVDDLVQVRVQGHYATARLMRPEAETMPLQTAKRGTTTEVFLPELRRLAVVALA